MSKIDLEQLKLMKELIEGKPNTTTVVPTMQVPNDRRQSDSFISAGNFLRSNWPILVTLAAAIFYIPSQFSAIASIDKAQDLRIDTNTQNIQTLTKAFEDSQDAQTTQNSEIVRKLDRLQIDIETIKEKQK